jgi:hypothetical protein
MKKLYTLSFILLATLSFGQVTLPHYDGFNYTVGQGLQTQSGWTVLNTGDDLAIASGNLSYTGLPASTGNKVAFGGAGIDASKSFTSQTANTVYYSLLLNVTDLSAVTSTTGGYCAGFIQGISTSFGATLWLKKIDATTFNIGVNSRTTAANTAFSATNYSVNQTYLVVISYTFNAVAADDVVKIWVNPTLGGAEPAAMASATNTGGTDLTSISQILVRQGSATDTPTVDIDELRIALTWADVTSVVLSVKQNEISGLNMYPNPVKNGNLYITSNSSEAKSVEIYDILGKQVLNAKVSNNAVNVSNLKGGAYIVKINEEGKTATRKLIIE